MPIRGLRGFTADDRELYRQTLHDERQKQINPSYKLKKKKKQRDDRAHPDFYLSDETNTDEEGEAEEALSQEDAGAGDGDIEIDEEELKRRERRYQDRMGQVIRKAQLEHLDVWEEGGADVIDWDTPVIKTTHFVEDNEGEWLVWKERGPDGRVRRKHRKLQPADIERFNHETASGVVGNDTEGNASQGMAAGPEHSAVLNWQYRNKEMDINNGEEEYSEEEEEDLEEEEDGLDKEIDLEQDEDIIMDKITDALHMASIANDHANKDNGDTNPKAEERKAKIEAAILLPAGNIKRKAKDCVDTGQKKKRKATDDIDNDREKKRRKLSSDCKLLAVD